MNLPIIKVLLAPLFVIGRQGCGQGGAAMFLLTVCLSYGIDRRTNRAVLDGPGLHRYSAGHEKVRVCGKLFSQSFVDRLSGGVASGGVGTDTEEDGEMPLLFPQVRNVVGDRTV